MSNTTKYLGEHFISALRILSYDPPDVNAAFLYRFYKHHANELIKCGALKKAPYSQEIYVFVDYKMAYRDVKFVNGVPSYYIGNGHWKEVDELEIKMYTSVIDWALRNIVSGLGASAEHRYNCILDKFIWSFGNIYLKQHKIPIIIARCITSEAVYQELIEYLNKYYTKTPALVLFIEQHRIPKFFAFPPNHIFLDINDVLVNELGKIYFNIDFILEKMAKDIQKEGFSNGYRSGYIKDVSYTFTKKEAEVIEYIYNARGKPVHQDEIMAEVSPNSKHSSISSIFRSRQGMHPAWDVVIQHDGKGNYWLNLK